MPPGCSGSGCTMGAVGLVDSPAFTTRDIWLSDLGKVLLRASPYRSASVLKCTLAEFRLFLQHGGGHKFVFGATQSLIVFSTKNASRMAATMNAISKYLGIISIVLMVSPISGCAPGKAAITFCSSLNSFKSAWKLITSFAKLSAPSPGILIMPSRSILGTSRGGFRYMILLGAAFSGLCITMLPKLTLVVFWSHFTKVTWWSGILLSATDDIVCMCGCDVPCSEDLCDTIFIAVELVRRSSPAGVEM